MRSIVALLAIAIMSCAKNAQVSCESYVEYTYHRTTYIAHFQDGHDETLFETNTPAPKIGTIFRWGSMKMIVTSVNNVWYDGIDLTNIYIIVKCEASK